MNNIQVKLVFYSSSDKKYGFAWTP